MKNIVLFLLLLSVGLNIGLAYKVIRPDVGPEPTERPFRGRELNREPGDGPGPGQDKEAFWQGMMERRFAKMAGRLDLSPEQAAAFRQRHAEAAADLLAQRREVSRARLHLHGLIAAGAGDADSVRAAINAISRQQSLMDSLTTETVLSEMELLDDSQRALYLENLPLRGGFGRGEGPGGGRNRRGH